MTFGGHSILHCISCISRTGLPDVLALLRSRAEVWNCSSELLTSSFLNPGSNYDKGLSASAERCHRSKLTLLTRQPHLHIDTTDRFPAALQFNVSAPLRYIGTGFFLFAVSIFSSQWNGNLEATLQFR